LPSPGHLLRQWQSDPAWALEPTFANCRTMPSKLAAMLASGPYRRVGTHNGTWRTWSTTEDNGTVELCGDPEQWRQWL